MAVFNKTQAGVLSEGGTYGGGGTVNRFFPYINESLKPARPRVQSKQLWAGARFQRADSQIPSNDGAAGALTLEVWTKQFAFWLTQMVGGTLATSGPTDSKYTYTATPGDLTGVSSVVQINRPTFPVEANSAFTMLGTKVKTWELSCKADDKDGMLVCKLDLDSQDVADATALAAASYPSGMYPYSYIGATVTLNGVSTDLRSFTLKGDNMLDFKKYMRGNFLKKEPFEKQKRALAWDMALDFADKTQYSVFKQTLASGIVEPIIVTFTVPVLIGAASQPTFVITIDQGSFDTFDNTVGSEAPLEQKIAGAGLYGGTNPAVTLAYGTAESTP